ncbi:MAG: CDP-alcohol phosphatidyltransferase family protein [Clostridia bacterium]|nr:CDP-alcohol phosphatidyltransferase family protein [Clostridia bacterium]
MKSTGTQERKKIRVDRVFTIPNMMSFFRIALIPFIIWAYFGMKSVTVTVILIAVSAVTDILDGWVARRFNQVSEFGIFIDPVADKLTQGTLLLCLIPKYKLIIALVAVFVIREVIMFFAGLKVKLVTDRLQSAKWYGKVNTVVVEGVIMALIIFTKIPRTVANILIGVCIVSVIVSLILYLAGYRKVLAEAEKRQAMQETAGEEFPDENEREGVSAKDVAENVPENSAANLPETQGE